MNFYSPASTTNERITNRQILRPVYIFNRRCRLFPIKKNLQQLFYVVEIASASPELLATVRNARLAHTPQLCGRANQRCALRSGSESVWKSPRFVSGMHVRALSWQRKSGQRSQQFYWEVGVATVACCTVLFVWLPGAPAYRAPNRFLSKHWLRVTRSRLRDAWASNAVHARATRDGGSPWCQTANIFIGLVVTGTNRSTGDSSRGGGHMWSVRSGRLPTLGANILYYV